MASSPNQTPNPAQIQSSPLAIEAPVFPDRTKEAEEAKKVDRQTVVVAPGDVLFAIAERSNTTVERLYAANPHIENPNLIEVGEKIRVPEPDEALPERTPEAPQPAPQPASESVAPQPAPMPTPQPKAAYTARTTAGLVGSYGYARAGGNCINEAGVNNPGYGNPINWPVTSYEPWIGATALWTYNHTGVVTGLWPNGDVEVRHQNWSGAPITRFPRSAFRGFR